MLSSHITIILFIASTSGHDDSEVHHFYQQLQELTDQTPKKDILIVQGIEMLKLGRMRRQARETFVDPTAIARQIVVYLQQQKKACSYTYSILSYTYSIYLIA